MRRILFALAALLSLAAPARAQDVTSPGLQLLLMGQGLHQNDWGSQTNLNLQKIESALAGATSIVLGGANVILTDDEARSAVIMLAGTLSANVNLQVPSRVKSWIIYNGTSGAFTVTVKTALAAGAPAPQGAATVFMSDGTNVRNASDQAPYATAAALAAVSTVANDALPKAGGTMTGAINMGSQLITSMATPVSPADATTKAYVDAAVASAIGGVVAVPAGAVMAFNLASCPAGWLAANGTAVALDLRGEFIRGLDGGRGVDSGRVLASSQAQDLQAHTHTLTMNTGSFPYNDGALTNPYTPGGTARATSSTGGAETRPRNVALLYCVKS